MPAKNGPPRLRRLMGRARGRDEPAGSAGSAHDADGWPGRHFGPDSDYRLYAEYADPLAESERQFMTEAREIMGLDQEPPGGA